MKKYRQDDSYFKKIDTKISENIERLGSIVQEGLRDICENDIEKFKQIINKLSKSNSDFSKSSNGEHSL